MIYDYKVKDGKGNLVSLEDYKGKVMLVVNTAIKCGLTPQYEGLENLYKKYNEKGLEILDFPCNQFFEQAPGTNDEIAGFCKMNFGTTFKMFGKIDVNGENADPVYKFLKSEAPKAEESELSDALYTRLEGRGFKSFGDDIKWNFTKFLVNREGKVLARFAPTVTPEELAKKIEEVL